jgi:hypothetical protein
MSFESLNVQPLIVGLPSRPHRKQDLAPFFESDSGKSFRGHGAGYDDTVISLGPFRGSETDATPVPEGSP